MLSIRWANKFRFWKIEPALFFNCFNSQLTICFKGLMNKVVELISCALLLFSTLWATFVKCICLVANNFIPQPFRHSSQSQDLKEAGISAESWWLPTIEMLKGPKISMLSWILIQFTSFFSKTAWAFRIDKFTSQHKVGSASTSAINRLLNIEI